MSLPAYKQPFSREHLQQICSPDLHDDFGQKVAGENAQDYLKTVFFACLSMPRLLRKLEEWWGNCDHHWTPGSARRGHAGCSTAIASSFPWVRSVLSGRRRRGIHGVRPFKPLNVLSRWNVPGCGWCVSKRVPVAWRNGLRMLLVNGWARMSAANFTITSNRTVKTSRCFPSSMVLRNYR